MRCQAEQAIGGRVCISWTAWCVITVGFLFSTGLIAQTATLSTIRGTAQDPSGAAVAEVAISLVNSETNFTRTATTNATGDYEFPYLQRGTYNLTATQIGFKKFLAENIILESSQTRRVDIPLQLGEAKAEVTVQANAAVISTEGATINQTLTSQKYDQIPMVAQYTDPNLVLVTMPGVVDGNGGNYAMHFNGQSPSQVQEGVDGVTEDTSVNQTNDMEFMQEMVAITSSASAEYSRAANFSLITHSGTNELHGRLLYSQVNEALDARNFFDPAKTQFRIHTLGANVGGPIRKNKTFFYAGWLALLVPSHSFKYANVPTAGMRGGDFSSLIGDGIILKDPMTGNPFPGNVIPPDRLNATSQKIQQLYIPTPNFGGPNTLVNNFGWLHPKPDDLPRMDDYLVRIDHKISDNNTITGRLIERWVPYWLSGPLPEFGWTRNRHHSTLSVEDTHLFTPALINSFRFGWIKDRVDDGKQNYGFKPPNGDAAVKAIGLEGVNPQGLSAMGFPEQNIVGFTSLSQVPGGILQDFRDLQYSDSVTAALGKHVLKFGGELRTFRHHNGTVPTGTYGSFNFDGSFTGYSYADFLLGLPISSFRLNPITNRILKSYEQGLFINDTFKVSSRLNLDLGLRWDYFGVGRYEDGLQYNFDRATGDVIIPSNVANKVSPLYPSSITIASGNVFPSPRKTNFRPRLGAAYRIGNTVIRGGFASYSEAINRFGRAQGGGPFQLGETYINSISNGVSLFQYPNPFLNVAGQIASQSVSGYPNDTHNGDIYQFNVNVEHQWRDVGLRLSYIGARDRGLNYVRNINIPEPSLAPFDQSRRPFPQFVTANVVGTNGSTNYNALQVEVQRKVGALSFDAHYTWAHAMSNFLNLENPYAPLSWNQDDVTPRQRFVMQLGYQLPFGHGASRALNRIAGGWTIYYVGFLVSGQYFTPTFSGSDPSNTQTFGGLPDRIGNGNLPPGQRKLDHWFDVSAFAVPPNGRFGNSGVNILEGPGYNAHHVSLNKDAKLTERFTLQFSWQVSNIFNHPNFLNPDGNISSPGTVGQISSDVTHWDLQKGGARAMEGKLRLIF